MSATATATAPTAPVVATVDVAKIEKAILKTSHPAANIFPMMSDDEFGNLVFSIRRNGFDAAKPILRKGDEIVDGRNREKAVQVINAEIDAHNAATGEKLPHVKAVYKECKLDDPSILEETVKDNFTRRQMSSSQKAAVAVKAEILSTAYGRKKEMGDEGKRVKGDIAELVAQQAGTNHVYIYKVKKLKQLGRNDLIESIIKGELTVMQAMKAVAEVGDGEGNEGDNKPAPDAILDGLKQEVSAEFKEIFETRGGFKLAVKALKEAKDQCNILIASAGGTILAERQQEANRLLSDLGRLIRDSEPHAVCPHCDGLGHEPGKKKEICRVCKGATFVSKPQYDRYAKDGVEEPVAEAPKTGAEDLAEPAAPKKAKAKAKTATDNDGFPATFQSDEELAASKKGEPVPE